MKAIQFGRYGDSGVLEVGEAAAPTIRAGEVLVRVKLAAVNPYDVKLRSGAMAEFVHPVFPVVPGSEVGGVVEQVGDDVAGLAVGDEVFGWSTSGGCAELAAARTVARKPPGLHWDVAVSLPVAGETATRGLRLLGVAAGETLLIHGAAGGVGAIATQLAVRSGVTVIGSASERDADAVRALGAHPVLYGAGLVERVRELAPGGIDAVFDTAGRGALPDSIELRGGTTDRIVTIADTAAYDLGITFSSGGTKTQSSELLAELAALAATGELVLPPARHFAFVEAAAAQDAAAAGGRRGKILLDL